MNAPRLEAIQIANFRSITGPVSIPLDAPIVLLHGTNGAGKSTVMSAIELALTGWLSGVDEADLEHLVHHGEDEATIEVISSEGRRRINLRDGQVDGQPLLEPDDARFFVERCYLQQRTLTRLLEIYQGDGSAESQLTRFVNDLLGLDELEDLLDGTHQVSDKRLFRHLVPEYAELELERDTRLADLQRLREQPGEAERAAIDAAGRLQKILGELEVPSEVGTHQEVEAFLQTQSREDELVELTTRRREVLAMQRQLERLGQAPETEELEALEKAGRDARKATDTWRDTHGRALEEVLASLRSRFPSLPDALTAEDPTVARSRALVEVRRVVARLSDAMARDAGARMELARIEAALIAANERLTAIDTQLGDGGSATDAEELAKVLAALLPHVHSDDCPVCGRGFSEISDEPLVAHLAARISSLSERAGRLSALASARLEAANDLAQLQEDYKAVEERLMSAEERSRSENELTSFERIQGRLVELEEGVAEGAGLTRTLGEAERQLVHASERSRGFAELVGAARAAAAASGRVDVKVDRVEETIRILADELAGRISAAERIERLRFDAQRYLRDSREHTQRQSELDREIRVVRTAVRGIDDRISAFDERREELWDLRRDAEAARNEIVRRVFNDALNAVWRDLFVRLAPEEAFVPVFRTPDARRQRLAAELATIYRDTGEEAGSPGSMLSAGNLNTAALTLFLALHLSVSPRLPWLLLDDPVQSMDEVHVQQFAALLRTLAKRLDRRIVIAVHERALFEYLSLELSAAQPDDALITVELSRSRDGATVVRPSSLRYVPDRALTREQAEAV